MKTVSTSRSSLLAEFEGTAVGICLGKTATGPVSIVNERLKACSRIAEKQVLAQVARRVALASPVTVDPLQMRKLQHESLQRPYIIYFQDLLRPSD